MILYYREKITYELKVYCTQKMRISQGVGNRYDNTNLETNRPGCFKEMIARVQHTYQRNNLPLPGSNVDKVKEKEQLNIDNLEIQREKHHNAEPPSPSASLIRMSLKHSFEEFAKISILQLSIYQLLEPSLNAFFCLELC